MIPNRLFRLSSVNRLCSSSLFSRYSSSSTSDDVVVIGGGPGGYVAAIKAAQLGLKVTCIEKRGTLGGTCLNVGCIPSKALLHASHLYHQTTHGLEKYGISIEGNVAMSVEKMMKQKEKSVKGLTGGIEFLFKKNKVRYVKGTGTINSPNEVEATLLDGKTEKINTKNILIATGSDVMSIPGVALDEEKIVSSTGALSLKEVPKRMVLIGAGVIGLEMGSVWSRLGAKVTAIEFLDSIAAGADEMIASNFKKILEKQGIEFRLGTKVTSAVRNENGTVSVKIESRDGKISDTLETDVVLVSVGRVPYTKGLGLEKVGVKMDDRGRVFIDEHFRTNIPSIRAIGDVVRGPMLAHKAEEEGIAAIENIMNSNAGHVNYGAIPSVIYTFPEVAWVGQTEQELQKLGVKYKVGTFPFQANSRARTNDEFYPEEIVKVLADEATDRILGVHIINASAGEMIAEAVLAMEYGASSEDLGRTCHAHPTLMEAVKEAAMAVYDKPIHF
jgi:dihydrolipoamide dehydrogenase